MKQTALTLSLILGLGVHGVVGASQSKLLNIWKGNNQIRVPYLTPGEAPRIDGKVGTEEWRQSQRVAGFVAKDGYLMVGKRGFVNLCRDERNLYLAIATTAFNNDPGGGLATRAKERDGPVYNDDSIEVLISPDSDTNTIYQIVVNCDEVIFDQRRRLHPSDSDRGWNMEGIKVGSLAESGWWHLELALPLAELGAPRHGVKINVARNWSDAGSSTLHATGSHFDRQNMIHLYWPSAPALLPVLRQQDLGDYGEGRWQVRLEAENPGERPCVLAGMLRHYLYPKVDGKVKSEMHIDRLREVVVPPGGKAELELLFDTNQGAPRWLTSMLYDQETGTIYSARLMQGRKQPALGRHPPTHMFELGDIGSGACWHYPGYDRARVRCTFRSSFKPVKVVAAAKGGAWQEALPRDGHYHALIPINPEAGSHPVEIRATSDAGAEERFQACVIEKRAYPWERNSYGKDRIILPPFTPLSVKDGRVSNLMNTCQPNKFGVWDSLVAKGEEILAAPMRVVMSVDGREAVWQRGGAESSALLDGGYESTWTSIATTTDGVTLEGHLHFEYDGFAWIKWRLNGVSGRKIDGMRLEIPLKNSQTPLFHAVSNTIRSNPSGEVPHGEGEVWDGAQLVRRSPLGCETIHPQLVPYIWLGGVERGLCWFLDSSYGMKLSREESALRLIRKRDTLTLSLDLINRPAALQDGHTIEFGMMATPVKPVDPEIKSFTRDSRGGGVEGLTNLLFVSGRLLGFPYNWSKTPYADDYSLFESVMKLVRQGDQADSKTLTQPWYDKYGAAIYEEMRKVPQEIPHYIESFHKKGYSTETLNYEQRKASLPIKYSDPRLTYTMDEVADYYKAEWWNPSPQNYFGAWRTFPVPSNLDYLMYGYYQELKHGMHGIYLDDVFLMPETNTDTVARVDDEGETHSCLGILALRELVKRISVLQHQFKRNPRVLEVHMTNALLIPCFSLATSQLGWESDFGESPLPERFRLDDIRAISLGLQLGAESLALGGIRRKTTPYREWRELFPRLTRSHLALSLPHGIKIKDRLYSDADPKLVFHIYDLMNRAGCWHKETRFAPYWEEDGAVTTDTPQALVSSYRAPAKVVMIVSNLGEGGELTLRIERERLGMSAESRLVDIESNLPLEPGPLQIPPNDFRLISLVERGI